MKKSAQVGNGAASKMLAQKSRHVADGIKVYAVAKQRIRDIQRDHTDSCR